MAQLHQTMDVDVPGLRLTLKVRHLLTWRFRVWAVSHIIGLAALVGGDAFDWNVSIETKE